MDHSEIDKKVNEILDNFGMSGKVAAIAMGVTYQTFRNKKNENNESHSFNKKNLEDLIAFIKTEAGKL